MKRLYGMESYIQSVGVKNDLEIDGFAITVCAELGVELSRHRSRSFDEMEQWGDDLSSFDLVLALFHLIKGPRPEMEQWGDDLSSFDLVLALSPASQRRALELTRFFHLDVEYWPVLDPTGLGETREAKLDAYRQTRDQIIERLVDRFGPPVHPLEYSSGP